MPPPTATLITKHIKDLIGRPLETVAKCAVDPNSKRDIDRRSTSKGLAARAMAAQAIMRAMLPNSVGNGSFETILERVEGKVASGETQAGAMIQFNFTLAPGAQLPGSVGEIIAGQLAQAQAPRLVNPSPPLALRSPRTDEYSEPDGAD